MAEFTLDEIYYSIASYKGLPFPLGIDQLPGYKIKKWEDRISILKGEKDVRDMYGRPFVAHATLGGIELGSSREDHIMMQPMMVLEGKKRMVKSSVEGGEHPGTIKQFINFDDYKLKIYGALVNRNQRDYPYEQVHVLQKMWKQNFPLFFTCYITEGLFDYVVIEKLKFHELKKSAGIQMYEIEALSDATLEVEMLRGDA
jgi:hypothetical protein